jgi:hypothetical protein
MVLHARMCWSNPIGIVRVLAAMKDQRVKYVIFKISINLKINLISYKIKFKKPFAHLTHVKMAAHVQISIMLQVLFMDVLVRMGIRDTIVKYVRFKTESNANKENFK